MCLALKSMTDSAEPSYSTETVNRITLIPVETEQERQFTLHKLINFIQNCAKLLVMVLVLFNVSEHVT